MTKIRILIADDHPMFRSGIKGMLAAVPEFEVVGLATSGEEIVQLARELQPDVILMDIQMPDLSGIEATRQILAVSPHIRILIVTMFEADQSVFTALRAGARGYILKDADEDEILRAILAVHKGEAIFSAGVAQKLIDFFATAPKNTAPQIFPELTEREREVLNLIAQGLNNAEIAERFSLSLKTVSNHISNIFSKLQVADRAEAIIRAW